MKKSKSPRRTKKSPTVTRIAVIVGGVALIAVLIGWYGMQRPADGVGDAQEPPLSAVAAEGKRAFTQNCASCHGSNANGTDRGPPLINKIYNPGHHSDEAIYRAVAQGSRQHHWRFGDMPAQSHVPHETVKQIIAYIREMQIANGIKYEPHRM